MSYSIAALTQTHMKSKSRTTLPMSFLPIEHTTTSEYNYASLYTRMPMHLLQVICAQKHKCSRSKHEKTVVKENSVRRQILKIVRLWHICKLIVRHTFAVSILLVTTPCAAVVTSLNKMRVYLKESRFSFHRSEVGCILSQF